MLSILDAYRAELPPTKTYRRREFIWIPVDPRHPESDGRMGNLTIKLQHSKAGVGRAVEYDTYWLEKDTPEPGDNGGLAFWFVNLTDKTQEEPYRCVVGGLNSLPRCKCMAGKCKVPGEPDVTEGCKHRDALLAMIAAGLMELSA